MRFLYSDIRSWRPLTCYDCEMFVQCRYKYKDSFSTTVCENIKKVPRGPPVLSKAEDDYEQFGRQVYLTKNGIRSKKSSHINEMLLPPQLQSKVVTDTVTFREMNVLETLLNYVTEYIKEMYEYHDNDKKVLDLIQTGIAVKDDIVYVYTNDKILKTKLEKISKKEGCIFNEVKEYKEIKNLR